MKETKEPQSSKLTEAEKEALIMETALRLPQTSLFPQKVAEAKALIESLNASLKNKTPLS